MVIPRGSKLRNLVSKFASHVVIQRQFPLVHVVIDTNNASKTGRQTLIPPWKGKCHWKLKTVQLEVQRTGQELIRDSSRAPGGTKTFFRIPKIALRL